MFDNYLNLFIILNSSYLQSVLFYIKKMRQYIGKCYLDHYIGYNYANWAMQE